MVLYLKRFLMVCAACLAASNAYGQDPDTVIVTTTGSASVDEVTTVQLVAEVDTDLNRRLRDYFIDELELRDIYVSSDAKTVFSYNGKPTGFADERDNTIGRISGNAEGDTEIELKVWSSGGGSSLLQGKRSNDFRRDGVLLNVALGDGVQRYWVGSAQVQTTEGDVFTTLSALVSVLTDRFGETVNTTIPLR